jgi:hypothetical protein
MSATPDKYLTPYVSQMLNEPDRVYDDCAAATGLMLGGDWTLGEILEHGGPRILHLVDAMAVAHDLLCRGDRRHVHQFGVVMILAAEVAF